MRFRRCWCMSALTAALVAGCGSSGTTSVPETATTRPATSVPAAPAPTKAQFIAKADAICAAGNGSHADAEQKKIDAAVRADQTNDTPAARDAVATGLEAEVAIANPLLDRLRALTPPTADRVVVSRYLAVMASQINLVDQLSTAIAGDDAATVTTVSQQVTDGKANLNGLAQGYGFKVCGAP
jgi:hypothetical protein